MDIEFKEGAVCFALGMPWYSRGESQLLFDEFDTKAASKEALIEKPDFQLNTIKQGDYIEASELGTEQRYNDLADVVGSIGFRMFSGGDYDSMRKYGGLVFDSDGDVVDCPEGNRHIKRKIKFNQLMAIGELKRFEIERDKQNQVDMLSMQSIEPRKQEVKMQKNKPVVAQVMIDLTERMEIGIKTYGEALRVNNGRDALQDAYEEALDLACYLKQTMLEREIANYEKALKGNGG